MGDETEHAYRPALIKWLEYNRKKVYTVKETAVLFLQMGNVKEFEL